MVWHLYRYQLAVDCYGGVMVSETALSAVDCVVWFLSGPTKDYDIGIHCFYTKHTALRGKSNSSWIVIRKMCTSEATCQPVDCYFSELALNKSNWACWPEGTITLSPQLVVHITVGLFSMRKIIKKRQFTIRPFTIGLW